MSSVDLAMLETKASIHKNIYGSWDVFSISIAWRKMRKKMNFIEREKFVEAWERV